MNGGNTAIENSLMSHRLDGSNFRTWRFQINAVLRAQDLVEIVNGDLAKPEDTATADEKKKWSQRDGKAMAVLFASLNADQSKLVLSCKSSKEIIDTLDSIHNKKSDVRVMGLYEEYFALKMSDDEKVASYYSRVDTLAHEIEDQGEKLSDNLKMCRIISGLTANFSNFRTVWFNIKEGRTMDALLAKLQLEEDSHNKLDREKSSSVEAAFSASKFVNKNKKKNKPESVSKATCFECLQEGHWRRDCPKLKGNGSSNKFEKGKNTRDSYFSATDSILKESYDDAWIGDSGATKHLTHRKDWFIEYSPTKIERGAELPNGQILDVIGTGTIEIEMLVDGEWKKQRMENVRYAPGATVNLFSLGTLTKKGFTVLLTEKECIIFAPDSKDVVARGFNDANNLIRMLFRCTSTKGIDSCLAARECGSSESLQQWHRRLGHINIATIKSMIKNNVISGINLSDENDFFCEECQLGKLQRSSHPVSEKRNVEKGECVHVDLCGPMETTGIGGARYFMLVKDEATTFRMIYCIKEKSEVGENLVDFLRFVRNSADVKIKRIRCDNGTEFINAKVQKILSENGIVIERIAPYTAEQNGFIERDNRTVQESARTMLLSSGLSASLWPEAVRTAVYILNRSTNSRSTQMTPYERWFGNKPQLDHLKVFGTVGYAHVPKIHRKKWDAKAMKVFLVGFEPTNKNFRLYNPVSKKVIVSCDVKFNENFIRSEYVTFPGNECVEEDTTSEATTPTTTTSTTATTVAENTTPATDSQDSGDESNESTEKTDKNPRKREGLRNNPKQTEHFQISMALSAIFVEPATFGEALKSSDKENWMEAVEDELQSLDENDTWKIVERPVNCNVIGCKWVFKLKTTPKEQPKYKARLVAKGYTQTAGIDYTDTFSPVVRYDSVRSVLAIAAITDMEMVQFDVKTAFLNGNLEETIYMEVPEGIEHKPNQVCQLKKSLYGLKQASRAWNSKFVHFLKSCGFEQSKADPCVFYGRIEESKVIILLYVDDGLILSQNKRAIDGMVKKLSDEFKITLGSCDYYVGMEIKRNRDIGSITITQTSYIDKIVEKFGMSDSKAISTPFDVGTILTKSEEELESNFPYRQACGSLMYAVTVSRPDIAYAVGEISKFMDNPNQSHVNAVRRIFRYLNHTKNLGITYGETDSEELLIGYTDADYARDVVTRRSTTGYVFKIGNGAVTWRSQRQPTVALSTTEAEFMAICDGAKESIWLRQLLRDIGFEQTDAVKLLVDNLSAIRLVQNPEMHHRTKHIDVRLFFVREVYEDNVIDLEHVSSGNQLADVLTKPLASAAFQINVMRLGMN